MHKESLKTIFTLAKGSLSFPPHENSKIPLITTYRSAICFSSSFLTMYFVENGVLSQSRNAAISTIPVKAIKPLNSHHWFVSKICPNQSSFPWR